MDRLHHDDPPWAGPYITLARLAPESDQAVPERRFIGRSADGDRTLLVRLPLPGADPARWATETEGTRRLSMAGFLPVEEAGVTGDLPWCTTPYVPALPLPAALRAHGGPLPEPAVRALATALAGTLVTAHAHGVTHAGLSPAAVLLTTGGPLTDNAMVVGSDTLHDLPARPPALRFRAAAGDRPRRRIRPPRRKQTRPDALRARRSTE
ncbi:MULTISPECIES: hypothetical protein [Streptomyces]|uniref:hypothetical protein n=1 Tax=Streptomyces TaxID=1883 RepID=UPI00068BE3F6|nr:MULTISPECIES: hypothetical protein [Streptomyces]RPK93717.1 Serine/threonine-protein kinase AfsK [Streptomyces sp. ADI98-10]